MLHNDHDFTEKMSKKTQKATGKLICAGVTICILFLISSLTVIPAGYVGVVDLFGNVYPDPLTSGLQLVNPFAKVVQFNIKTQLLEMAEDVPTKEGLTVHLEASALFHIEPIEAVRMYKTVGERYVPKVLEPQFRSVIRSVTSGHDAKDLYTSIARTTMSVDIKVGLNELVQHRGLVIEETPLRKLQLPDKLVGAIEEKLNAEQESQKMQFVLQRERQEAERKSIEATGIADFQKIVSGDITEGMLRWKGIEATQHLAASCNAKMVVVGSGPNGLPLILNQDDKPLHDPHKEELRREPRETFKKREPVKAVHHD
jgi:regulator of protease activity HflC (stomatin/prohibitin superfamily)